MAAPKKSPVKHVYYNKKDHRWFVQFGRVNTDPNHYRGRFISQKSAEAAAILFETTGQRTKSDKPNYRLGAFYIKNPGWHRGETKE